MRVFVWVWSLILLSTAAVAQEQQCYERRYDDAHMQKHKLQEVTRLKLELSSGDLTGVIAASFRELPDYLGSAVTCTLKGSVHVCRVDNGGGLFEFSSNAKGIRLVNREGIRFGGVDDGVSIGREPEHKLFLLFATPCGT
jgi:hypothetical protein